MTITLQQARPLCTKSELELVQWSMPKRVKELDATRLRQKLSRARKLRDKFRDLGDSQKRQIRGKEGRASKGGPAQDNRNTRLKQQLFDETAERFAQALDKLEAGAGAGGTKATKKKASKKAAKKTSKKATKKVAKKVAKKAAKKTGKKAGKKVSKKAGATTGDAASAAKRATKKAGKKAGKKAAKKSGKKIMRRASSLIGSELPKPLASLTPNKKQAIKKALASKENRRNNESLVTISEELRPKVQAQELDQTGAMRHQGHVSSRTRRDQAKRDSR